MIQSMGMNIEKIEHSNNALVCIRITENNKDYVIQCIFSCDDILTGKFLNMDLEKHRVKNNGFMR
jgi:hypothetical protein